MSIAPAPWPKYASLDAAARFAGLSVKTLERKIRSGQLAVFRVGRRRLVELEGVDRLVRGADDGRPD